MIVLVETDISYIELAVGGVGWTMSPLINLVPFIDCKTQSPYFYMQRLTNTIINLLLPKHKVLCNPPICLYGESLRRQKSWWGCRFVLWSFSLDRFKKKKNLKNRKDCLPDTFWQLLIILEWFNTLSVRERWRLCFLCLQIKYVNKDIRSLPVVSNTRLCDS